MSRGACLQDSWKRRCEKRSAASIGKELQQQEGDYCEIGKDEWRGEELEELSQGARVGVHVTHLLRRGEKDDNPMNLP